MPQQPQRPHTVRAIFNRHGEPLTRATIGDRLYEQDAPLDPLPPDATCAVCAGSVCHCGDGGPEYGPDMVVF